MGLCFQLIHLFWTGGEEQVADSSLLDLSFQSSRRVKIKNQRDVRLCLLVFLRNLLQRLRQAGGGEYCQLGGFRGRTVGIAG